MRECLGDSRGYSRSQKDAPRPVSLPSSDVPEPTDANCEERKEWIPRKSDDEEGDVTIMYLSPCVICSL